MALPVTIPNTFANATASIPLSQLDTNFNTLANAVNGISDGSESLANVSVTGGTISNVAVSATTLNTSGAVVFNDAGADVDFRVEGDTDANLLFVDASTDRIGMGSGAPSEKLTLSTSVSSTYASGLSSQANPIGTNVRIENASSTTDTFAGVTFNPTNGGGQGQLAYIGGISTGSGLGADIVLGGRAASGYYATRMTLDSSGNVGIGTTTAPGGNGKGVAIYQSDYPRLSFRNSSTGDGSSDGVQMYMVSNDYYQFNNESGAQIFGTAGTERARIVSAGNFVVGSSDPSFGDGVAKFFAYGTAGTASFAAQSVGSVVAYINRETDDGTLIEFRQANSTEGSISVSGNTVSYNPFLGSHAGALADWSRPDIKIGTVMDTINELLEYKVVVIDVREDVPAKDAVLDEEGNEVEPAQEATTQTVQKRISYNGNGAVGSTATVEYEGQEYTGTIQHEREEPLSFNKHLKVKINDTAASKTVFGVFVGWNNDPNNDGGVYNDMLVGAVGNYVIRMAAGQTPEAGDLVEADGNGCAVVQDDDIIRTKTIAKVTSTIKQVTYDDGSFLVTCVLYCG